MIKQIYEIINIFSASLPYYAQIKKFQSNQSSEGYSNFVSFFVLTSSILKVFFWFGKYYHWSLLFQAILISITHVWLLFESIKYKNLNLVRKTEKAEEFKNDDLKQTIKLIKLTSYENKSENILTTFFQWNQIQLYFLFLIFYTLFLAGVCNVFGYDNFVFIEFLGLVNTFIEGALAVPQVMEILKTKNVDNLSVVLILCWFIGDFLKTYYFIVSGSPFQFTLLGVIQISLNCVIVFLYLKYKK